MNEKPRLLVVSPLLPWPLDAGGKLRMYHILKGMSARYRITLLTLAVDEENSEENRKPFDFLEDLIMIPISQGRVWQVLRMLANLPRWLAGMPAETVVKRSPALLRACRRMAGEGRFDAVQIEFTQNIQYLDAFEGSGIPAVLVAHDVSFVSHERRAEVSKGLRKWFWSREARMMRGYERAGWRRFDRIVSMSAVDRDIIVQNAPDAEVDVVPNGVDTVDLQPIKEGEAPTLIFVGWMRHLPNPDAVTWFLDEIWPLIKAGDASVRFAIVGKGLSEQLKRRVDADDQVDYRGYVDDVGKHVGEAWASVVPLRIGSGTRLKILESMALGTPVVATAVGAEGIAARDGEHLRIADAPADFARAVLELLADQACRRGMASSARRLVESDYDWKAIAEAAGDAVARAIGGGGKVIAKSDIAGRIAIVIVDYNSEALLRRCLDSILRLDRGDLVFIVVDNGGSIDNERFRADYPLSILLRPGSNLGFAGGCNMGLRAALDGDAAWCLLLNPDTRIESDFLSPLIEAFEADPGLGMACPTILVDDEAKDIWFAGGRINWWVGRPISFRDRSLLDRGGVQPVPYLTGCAMMLRPSAVREVGLMEDSYFLYFEDIDYTRAFIGAGWKAAYVPAAELLHSPSSTTGFQSNSYVYYFARNRVLFMRRWANWPHWLVFLLFHSLVRLPGALIVFGLLRRRPGTALAFLKGWAAGVTGR